MPTLNRYGTEQWGFNSDQKTVSCPQGVEILFERDPWETNKMITHCYKGSLGNNPMWLLKWGEEKK